MSQREKDVTASLLLICLFYLVTTLMCAFAMATHSTMKVTGPRDVILRRLVILCAVSIIETLDTMKKNVAIETTHKLQY